MSEGFFSRWAKRKDSVRRGEDVAPEPAEVVPRVPPPLPATPSKGQGLWTGAPQASPSGGTERQPLPTIEDTHTLTPTSDFTRFVQPDVPPEVKNAALKKLFADPHFNQMDGLDVYIDDYNKPDPLPAAMLRQLASAKSLKLFDEQGETGEHDTPHSVAQSDPRTGDALPPAAPHADPDLRLQQDDAPGPEVPGADPR